jgi:hypothetical protein
MTAIKNESNENLVLKNAQFDHNNLDRPHFFFEFNGVLSFKIALNPAQKLSHKIQTILDFEHNSAYGCALQISPENDGYAKVNWISNGESLEIRIPYKKTSVIEGGVSTNSMKSWLLDSSGGCNFLKLEKSPFIGDEIKFGVGHWLGGAGRDFFGEIESLVVSSNEMLVESNSRMSQLKKKIIPIKSGILSGKPALKPDIQVSYKKKPLLGNYRALPAHTWLSLIELKDASLIEYEEITAEAATPIFNLLEKHLDKVLKEDVIGAAYYLNQIIDAGFGVRVLKSDENNVINVAFFDGAFDLGELTQDLLDIDFHHAYSDSRFIESLLVSCLQSIYRKYGRGAASIFAKQYYSVADIPSFVFQDVDLAQARREGSLDESTNILIKNLAEGGLDYLKFFQGKFCSHPFDDFEIRSDGAVFVCCPSYLPVPIGNIFDVSDVAELSESNQLFKIKESIKDQDFRYCSWIKCGKILDGRLDPAPHVVPEVFKPIEFRLSYDPTCNLWCPSCRTEKIVAVGEERDRFMKLTDDIVIPLLKDAEKCMMNGYGDIFASRACRKILKTVNQKDFPKLKFNFITNGVLLTSDEWFKFPNIHNMVNSIRVSIDAATEETYNKVRLGGNWVVLQENLRFISTLRANNIIADFVISMVIQDDNYEEMLDFSKLALNLNCDAVVFEPIMNWNVLPSDVFKNKAIHYSDNPKHSKFRSILESVYASMHKSNQSRIKLGLRPVNVSVNF